ncbi:MAG: tRNA dihydrouridine(20/20a) synthase DusA [Pseudomonadales bacterium]
MKDFSRRFCCAPLMDWSDRHCRYLWRLASRHALLYTEMVTTGALIHGDTQRFMQYNEEEHPVALQLGGSNPADLAHCAKLAQKWGYDEVNLNVGCPSDRVQNGMFGACLMANAPLVAESVSAMKAACDLPVTVKHRIGIDDLESYEWLCEFVETVHQGGCDTFIVHARKAILSGLSPKQNREIPPLKYDVVYQLKRDYPQLEIILNGGVTSIEDSLTHLDLVDGVMLGRAAYHNPWLVGGVDEALFYTPNPIASAEQLVTAYLPYMEQQLSLDVPLNRMSKHLLGLFQGIPGARLFRRHISENAHLPGAGIEVILDALQKIAVQQAINEAL